MNAWLNSLWACTILSTLRKPKISNQLPTENIYVGASFKEQKR
jgi:hypothetical protein